MKTHQARPMILSQDDVLSKDECAEWIAWAEQRGFHRSPVMSEKGREYDEAVRNNERFVSDDPGRAKVLFDRLREHLPRLQGWAPTGCNERIRIYRYDAGMRFRRHRDAAYERQDGERSKLTLLVYLSDEFEGGETWFPQFTYSPRLGAALLFEHDQDHAGVVVTEGRKYVARSDVMYFPDWSQP